MTDKKTSVECLCLQVMHIQTVLQLMCDIEKRTETARVTEAIKTEINGSFVLTKYFSYFLSPSRLLSSSPRSSFLHHFNYLHHLYFKKFFRYNNRTYRVEDVDFTMNPTKTFLREGREISFIKYFQEVSCLP